MTYEDIKKAVDQKPFRPLEFRLDDGKKFRFKERYGILLSPQHLSLLDEHGDIHWPNFDSVVNVVYLDEIVEVY